MKNLFTYLLLAGLALSFFGCGSDDDDCSDVIWDFANYELIILAYDSQTGKNFFDPRTENNLLEDGVWITYKGKTFNMVDQDWDGDKVSQKALYCPTLALRYYSKPSTSSKMYILGFGNFAPERDYRDETFTIHWADGTTDEVKFDCYITWNKCDPTIHRALYLNGEKVTLSDYSYAPLIFYKDGKDPK